MASNIEDTVTGTGRRSSKRKGNTLGSEPSLDLEVVCLNLDASYEKYVPTRQGKSQGEPKPTRPANVFSCHEVRCAHPGLVICCTPCQHYTDSAGVVAKIKKRQDECGRRFQCITLWKRVTRAVSSSTSNQVGLNQLCRIHKVSPIHGYRDWAHTSYLIGTAEQLHLERVNRCTTNDATERKCHIIVHYWLLEFHSLPSPNKALQQRNEYCCWRVVKAIDILPW
jgi:hypothetical protein